MFGRRPDHVSHSFAQLNLLGGGAEVQRAQRLRSVLRRGADVHEDARFAVAAERALEQLRQFWVTVRHVHGARSERREHLAQRRQRFVDGGRLHQPLARRVRFRDPLRPGQVDQGERATRHSAGNLVRAHHVQHEQQVRARAGRVHFGGADSAIRMTCGEQHSTKI